MIDSEAEIHTNTWTGMERKKWCRKRVMDLTQAHSLWKLTVKYITMYNWTPAYCAMFMWFDLICTRAPMLFAMSSNCFMIKWIVNIETVHFAWMGIFGNRQSIKFPQIRSEYPTYISCSMLKKNQLNIVIKWQWMDFYLH